MKEGAQMSFPPVNKRPVSNSKEPNEAAPQTMEPPPSAGEKSPPKKKTLKQSKLDPTHLFEAVTADASCEIKELFEKFAEVLCEKAVADTAMMQELEGIVSEARNLEAHLIEKKNHLRQTLELISDKLCHER